MEFVTPYKVSLSKAAPTYAELTGMSPPKPTFLPQDTIVSSSWLLGKRVILGAHIEPYQKDTSYPHSFPFGNWSEAMTKSVGSETTAGADTLGGSRELGSFDKAGLCFLNDDCYWWRIRDLLSPTREFVVLLPLILAGALWQGGGRYKEELATKRVLLSRMLPESSCVMKLPLEIPASEEQEVLLGPAEYKICQITDPEEVPSQLGNPVPLIAHLSDGSTWPCHRLLRIPSKVLFINFSLVGRI